MYGGKRKYGTKKAVAIPSPVPVEAQPTFICSKCKQLKNQKDGYLDIPIVELGRVTKIFRICNTCVLLLKMWVG